MPRHIRVRRLVWILYQTNATLRLDVPEAERSIGTGSRQHDTSRTRPVSLCERSKKRVHRRTPLFAAGHC
jgi:hypothetical protein